MSPNSNELQLTQLFKYCCEQYFEEKFQQNRFLYFDKIPHSYLGTDYKVEISQITFMWSGNPEITYMKHNVQDRNDGKNKCQFRGNCLVSYYFKVNSLMEIGRETKTINFFAYSFEPYGMTIFPTIEIEELIVFDNHRKIKQNIKQQFKVENIDELKYPGTTGFGFFADILRKPRSLSPLDTNISHAYFYYEIAHCHGEIETCLLTALMHQKYLSDLLDKKVGFEGKEFYMPNISYSDMQYLVMVGFGLERLYSFWDRITYLLYNFEPLGFKKAKDLSFGKYFSRIEEYLNLGKQIKFDSNSNNFHWLLNFYKTDFIKITSYRHRIVHYEMTPKWEGVLSAKFVNNAYENTFNRNKLNEIKLEFEGLGYLLLEQFKFCNEGFIRALNLIDELK